MTVPTADLMADPRASATADLNEFELNIGAMVDSKITPSFLLLQLSTPKLIVCLMAFSAAMFSYFYFYGT